ncbi:MAG: peroxiredoxin [Bacillota bacterium]|jgi:peroxiredoxin (alkyl hydroperoxide reductase subunit C)|nr:peroxiredoxin [Candidatus Fermentithermobacillaceae bacterium]
MTCKPERAEGFPLLGDPFPEMRVHTTHGPKNIPGDYKGKWFMLFSHPADFTPVCTTEFVSFAKRFKGFQELNCELIGLSADQVHSHIKWVEWIKDSLDVEIPFPIIADNGDISKRLGMIHPGKGTNTVRAVFLVDPEGIVRLILYYPQEIGRNVDEILRAIKAFQVSDEHKVAVPANWPNNEIIGDSVIIPPPSDEAGAKARKGAENCFDWWFCYKKL